MIAYFSLNSLFLLGNQDLWLSLEFLFSLRIIRRL